MPKGNTFIQELTRFDKYSRWIPHLQRRETWAETTQRVVDFFKLELHKQDRRLDESVWNELTAAMLAQEVLPSMRAVQMAGPAAARDHTHLYNCFAGDEQYVTRDGVKTFKATVDTWQDVLAGDGQWRRAYIQSFGYQPLQQVELRPGANSRTRLRKIVRVTPNHRWITTTGETTALKVGDLLPANESAVDFSVEEWVRGFGYGDGTQQNGYCHVRLCGAKAKWLPYFLEAGGSVTYPASNNGDPSVYFGKSLGNWKDLPTQPSPSWMQGLLAADGHNSDVQPGLSTQSVELANYIVQNAAQLGVVVTGWNRIEGPSNFGLRAGALIRLGIRPTCDVQWRVMSITPCGHETVYCATEPVTRSFTLASGVLTGNCSYLPLDGPEALKELLYILMCGTGVGYSVEQQYIDKWRKPKTPEYAGSPITSGKPYIIEDSSLGWAEAFHRAIDLSLEGVEPEFDYGRIRPQGARLHTKGGRASGPEPLRRLLTGVWTIISARKGDALTSFDVHRIACLAGSIVDVGGVRRAALIALFSAEDERMRTCKTGDWFTRYPELAKANNSMVARWGDIERVVRTLKSDGYGEPGLFNRAQQHARVKGVEYGTNPCLTGDTVIATVGGPRTFAELAASGEDVDVYAWHPQTKLPVIRTMRRPHKTRTNVPVLEVTFDSGLKVRATHDHCFYSFRGSKVAAKDLRIGQSVRAWSLSEHRDGHLRVHGWDSSRNVAVHQWVHRMIWENAYGPIPADKCVHHINGDEKDNRLDNLELVTATEHNQKHYQERFENGFDGKARNHKVTGIVEAGYADVYNGCVDDAHTYIVLDPHPVAGRMSGIVSANCGEILLEPHQFCNLSIAVAREHDQYVDLRRKVELATIWGTIQSCMTYFPNLRPEWTRNCQRERLLGVDITGAQDCHILNYNNGYDQLERTMRDLRQIAIATNAEYAYKLGINASAAVTCNKPSGNSSQLVDCSSGIHARWAPYYVRRLRIELGGPLDKHLAAKGIPRTVEGSTSIIELPVASPEGAVTKDQLTALGQLNYWLAWQRAWCQHNASSTIYVRPEEWGMVERWLLTHWEYIGGLSFLPKDDHKYENAPYESIDLEEYERREAQLPEALNLDQIVEWSDTSTLGQDAACIGGVCEIQF